MLEIFKDIKGYEGLYQVSNLGNVKSLNYNHTGKERILKPGKIRNGYMFLFLCKNGIRKKFLVHRLVAQAFLDNPNNLKQVNHKDFNKQNNSLQNLEWCDAKYNITYSQATKIKRLDLETKEIKYYPLIREAARQLNGSSSTAIYYNIYKSESPYKNRYFFSEINIEK